LSTEAQDPKRQLQTIISEEFQVRPPAVLDAGCGAAGPIEIPPDAHVTGIDISEEQLARNMSLDDKILGDLQSYPLPEDKFDLAICWDVLEHLDDPEAACRNMWSALRANGLLVLGFPNSRSVKGLVTRFTPHWAHVQAYRRVFGMPEAGTGDHAPFPTRFKPFMAPEGIRAFAAEKGARHRGFHVPREHHAALAHRRTPLARSGFRTASRPSRKGHARSDKRPGHRLRCGPPQAAI
jgi:SAM-dependent methyltransferase